jgi:cystathionine beta-lyase
MSGKSTRAIHAGHAPAPRARTVGPVIERGSTVIMERAADLYDESQVTYGRTGLAAQEALISALADLEGARAVRLFPSGLAAMTGSMLAVLSAGDEVLVTDGVYKPTRRFCERVLKRLGIGVRYFRPGLAPEALLEMAQEKTRLIILESPASLTFEMQDVPAIARLARAREILTLMDNTWAAGVHFQPLAHGVDLSVQALTKYVGGHSDVFMGSAAAACAELEGALDRAVWDFGWAVSPDDAYQMLRGLRTLPVRLARHQESAMAVARWLEGRTEVAEVIWPALPSSPDHALWRRDYTGAAGLFSFVLRQDADAHAALDALEVFCLGFSWGGFESLALDCDAQFRVRQSPPSFAGPMIRLSVGLEDPADLIADLERALAAA